MLPRLGSSSRRGVEALSRRASSRTWRGSPGSTFASRRPRRSAPRSSSWSTPAAPASRELPGRGTSRCPFTTLSNDCRAFAYRCRGDRDDSQCARKPVVERKLRKLLVARLPALERRLGQRTWRGRSVGRAIRNLVLEMLEVASRRVTARSRRGARRRRRSARRAACVEAHRRSATATRTASRGCSSPLASAPEVGACPCSRR